MLGIGFEEMLVIALIVLIAVGPNKMPTFVKAIGKGMREFRRASRQLRESVGLDDLLRDGDLRDPLGLKKGLGKGPIGTAPPRDPLSTYDLRREYPPEGPDVHDATRRARTTARAHSFGALTPEMLTIETPSEGVDIAHVTLQLRTSPGPIAEMSR